MASRSILEPRPAGPWSGYEPILAPIAGLEVRWVCMPASASLAR